jgi:hypothetical protein
MSATLKGLFGGASSKLLGSIMGRGSGSNKSDESAEEQEELWFTSLDDFKPICHMLHRGRYMTAYFACANKTGQHFLLKKFDKRECQEADLHCVNTLQQHTARHATPFAHKSLLKQVRCLPDHLPACDDGNTCLCIVLHCRQDAAS